MVIDWRKPHYLVILRERSDRRISWLSSAKGITTRFFALLRKYSE